MYPATLMPGAFRLRAIHPLLEEDGMCALVYDLERAAVIEVPSELQLYIGAILERGDLDEAVLSWLVREDLLTSEGQGGWAERASASESLLGLENPGWSGTALRLHDEFQARIENIDRRELAQILPLALRQSLGARTVSLHFDWVRRFPDPEVLAWTLSQLHPLVEGRGRALRCEVSLALDEVTPRVVDLLANHPIQVRVVPRSDAEGGGWRDEVALRQLIVRLEERLTLQIDPDRLRLREVWEWAQRAGLRHLDLAPSEGHQQLGTRENLGSYRADLQAICDDILAGLAEGRFPCDFLPLTRLVGRLRHSEPRAGEPLEAAFPSVWLYRKSGTPTGAFEGMAKGAGSGAWVSSDDSDLELGGDASSIPCRTCWARWICGHSAYVASSLGERNSQTPSRGRCARWRLEAEAAVRFYHQLAQTDPMQALRFFEDLPHGAELPLDAREEIDFSQAPF